MSFFSPTVGYDHLSIIFLPWYLSDRPGSSVAWWLVCSLTLILFAGMSAFRRSRSKRQVVTVILYYGYVFILLFGLSLVRVISASASGISPYSALLSIIPGFLLIIILSAATLDFGLALAILTIVVYDLALSRSTVVAANAQDALPPFIFILVIAVPLVAVFIYVRIIQGLRDKNGPLFFRMVIGGGLAKHLVLFAFILLVAIRISSDVAINAARAANEQARMGELASASVKLESQQERLVSPLHAIVTEVQSRYLRGEVKPDRELKKIASEVARETNKNIWVLQQPSRSSEERNGGRYKSLLVARARKPASSLDLLEPAQDFVETEQQELVRFIEWRYGGSNLAMAPLRDRLIGDHGREDIPLASSWGGWPEVIPVFHDQRTEDWNSAVFFVVATSSEPRWWEWAQPGAFPPGTEYIGLIWLSGVVSSVTAVFLLVLSRSRLRYELIQSEERARITQEAHDRISNRLSALAIAAETHTDRQWRAQEFFGQLPGTLRGIVTELKEVTSRSPGGGMSTGADFKGRLQHVCDKRAHEHCYSVQTDFKVDQEAPVPGRTAEALVLCLEEALGNVAKHAGAEHVEVAVVYRVDGDIRLTVTDDGRGFEPPQDFSMLRKEGHHGLAAIAERIRELGGDLNFSMDVERGARLEIVLFR